MHLGLGSQNKILENANGKVMFNYQSSQNISKIFNCTFPTLEKIILGKTLCWHFNFANIGNRWTIWNYNIFGLDSESGIVLNCNYFFINLFWTMIIQIWSWSNILLYYTSYNWPPIGHCGQSKDVIYNSAFRVLYETDMVIDENDFSPLILSWNVKVYIFWEGHKILRNLHLTFDWHCIGQK